MDEYRFAHCEHCGSIMVRCRTNDLWACLNGECGDGRPEALSDLTFPDFVAECDGDEDLAAELAAIYAVTFCDSCGCAYHPEEE